MEADPEQLTLGPAAVLHAIADHVVDRYIDVVDAVEGDIDTMEEQVFAPRTAIDIEQIYLMKREVVELRRAVAPLGTPLKRLVADTSPLIDPEIRRYFRDVDDHQEAVAERVADYDSVLTSLVDAALAKLSVQQNDDMRKIAAYAAIITVPTLIAGIYGMNFKHMPELSTQYGYPVVLLVMLTACAALWRASAATGGCKPVCDNCTQGARFRSQLPAHRRAVPTAVAEQLPGSLAVPVPAPWPGP